MKNHDILQEPKFKVGETVYYPTRELKLEVVRIINLKDPHDVKQQGFRYELRSKYRSFLESVPEKFLEYSVNQKQRRLYVQPN